MKANKEQAFFALLINLYILRMAIPYLVYLFAPILLISSIYFFLYFLKSKSFNLLLLKTYLKTFWPFLILVVFMSIGLLNTENLYFHLVKDIVDILVLILFGLLLLLIIKNNLEKFKDFTSIFLNQLSLFAILVSISGLFKYALQISGIQLDFLIQDKGYPSGTSLVSDNNFFTLFLLIGLLSFLVKNKQKKSFWNHLFTLTITLAILLTGSRRGIILLLLLYFGLIIYELYFRMFIKKKPAIFFNQLKSSLIFLGSLLIIVNFFLFLTSSKLKEQIADKISSNPHEFRITSTHLLYDYYTLLNQSKSFSEVYEKIWYKDKFEENSFLGGLQSFFDTLFLKDKAINYKVINKEDFDTKIELSKDIEVRRVLSGKYKGAYLLASKSKGSLSYYFPTFKGDSLLISLEVMVLDSSKNSYISFYNKKEGYVTLKPKNNWENDDQWHLIEHIVKPNENTENRLQIGVKNSHVLVKNIKVEKASGISPPPGSLLQMKNFLSNGNFINGLEHWQTWRDFSGEILQSNDSVNYLFLHPFKQGGIFQKFEIGIPTLLTISAKVKIIKWSKKLRISTKNHKKDYALIPDSSWAGDNLWHPVEKTIYFAAPGQYPLRIIGGGKKDSAIALITDIKVTDYQSEITTDSHLFPQPKTLKADELLSHIKKIEEQKKEQKRKQELLLKRMQSERIAYSESKAADDLDYKKEFTQTFASDSVQLAENLVELRNEDIDQLAGSRTIRWKFAWTIFNENYSVPEKLFGGGFDFFGLYGKKFFNNPLRVDFPHNPILSILLYAGITGMLYYLFFLILIVRSYLKGRKFGFIFFVIFFFSFYFIFFSGYGTFGIPSYGFGVIMAFYVNYLFKNKAVEKNKV